MTDRFSVDTTNRSNVEKAVLALREAIDIATAQNLTNITIVVPNIGSFDDTDLGEAIDSLNHPILTASRLRRHKPIVIEGISFDAVPSSNIKNIRSAGVLIAYASTLTDLGKIDNLNFVDNIIYVPWLPDEERSWVAKWNPTII